MTEQKKFSTLEKIFSPNFPLLRSKLQESNTDGLESIGYTIELLASAGLDCFRLGTYLTIAHYLLQ